MRGMSRLIVLFALVVMVAAGAVGANAASQTPFSGRLSGEVTESFCAPLTICLSGTISGTATHMGRAQMTKSATVHITSTPCGVTGLLTTYTEDVTITAANGDTVTLTGGGTACAENGAAVGSGELTVTGGTGRFAGASGTITESIDHNLVTGFETTELSGMISSPGSTH